MLKQFCRFKQNFAIKLFISFKGVSSKNETKKRPRLAGIFLKSEANLFVENISLCKKVPAKD